MSRAGNQGLSLQGQAVQLLTASACSTAASDKLRVQISNASAYWYPTVVSYKLRCAVCQLRLLLGSRFTKLRCAVQATRGAVCEGSYLDSDSFSALVLNSGQWQVPDASFTSFSVQVPNSGQLQASVCKGASCEYYFTRVLQNCGVLCKEPEAQFARASCPVSDRFRALMQSASCVYYLARVLHNCDAPWVQGTTF